MVLKQLLDIKVHFKKNLDIDLQKINSKYTGRYTGLWDNWGPSTESKRLAQNGSQI